MTKKGRIGNEGGYKDERQQWSSPRRYSTVTNTKPGN